MSNSCVGVDLQATVGQHTGLGTYCHHLFVEAMAAGDKSRQSVTFDDLSISFFSDPSFEIKNTLQRLDWENFRLPRMLRNNPVDLLHVPAFSPSWVKYKKLVVTVHDLIGITFPNQIGKLSRFYWQTWLPTNAKKADFILADSEATKQDVMKYLKVQPDKIRVVYPSGHESFQAHIPEDVKGAVKAKFDLTRDYYIFVGTLEPRKNLKRVVEAFLKLSEQTKESPQLIVVGSKDFAHGSYFQGLVQELGIREGQVGFTGYISQNELNALYCGAEALLFPSLYEGFGIPILEGMAAGIPVITSNVSSTPEVAGDAALLVDPRSVTEIAEAMFKLKDNQDLRSDLVSKGFEQIKKFSWEKSAHQVVEVYKQVLGS